MKKVVLGVILLLVLAACAPKVPAAEKSAEGPVVEKTPTETVAEQPKTQVTQTAPAPQTGRTPPVQPLPSERVAPQPQVEVAPKQDLNPQIRDLLKRAEEKVQSVQYLYGGSDTGNLFLDTFIIKGDKLKIKKYEGNDYVRENYFDTVYVNDGIGCCEKQSRCLSNNIDNRNKRFDVDTATLSIAKTPYQWLKEIKSNAQVIGPQTIDARSVTYIKYTDEHGQEVSMWLDDSYGLPHKIIVKDSGGNEVKYQFNDMLFNPAKDADFVPPCKNGEPAKA